MKYIIDVPDNTTWIQVSTDRLTPYTEPDRKAVEDEVWDFARAINYMGYNDFVSCFSGKTEEAVMNYPTPKLKPNTKQGRIGRMRFVLGMR